MKLKEIITLVLKGIAMGAANSVPGVSGGTIAFITGIYERFVNCLNNVNSEAVKLLFKGRFKELWQHIDGNFLCAILGGVLIAMFSFAKLMLILLADYSIQTWAFFFGLIIASSIIMLSGISKWRFADVIWLIFGGILGVAVCTMTPMETPDGLWFIFLCGALSICAMILPGISGSFILLVMGKYEYIMEQITAVLSFDSHAILVLSVFGLGCVVGILAFAKLLHWLLAHWERQTMIVLSGFVLGSLVKVWPWNSYVAVDPLLGTPNDSHIAAAIIWCIAGAALVLGLEWAGKHSQE